MKQLIYKTRPGYDSRNRCSFNRFLKMSRDDADVTSAGRSFHISISIYDGFLLVCDTGWFVLVPYRCFSVIVISETICISFDFSPVFYITLITTWYMPVYCHSCNCYFVCMYVCYM